MIACEYGPIAPGALSVLIISPAKLSFFQFMVKLVDPMVRQSQMSSICHPVGSTALTLVTFHYILCSTTLGTDLWTPDRYGIFMMDSLWLPK